MQIVKIMGGLGNQMFTYAFALRLRSLGRDAALDTSWHDRISAHNGWELGRIFSLDIPECEAADRDRLGDLDPGFFPKLRRKLLGPRKGHYEERGPGYDPRFLSITGDAYFDGYWQSPRYHEGVASEVAAAFCFPGDLEPEADRLLTGLAGRSVIGVHVRRGDYVGNESLGSVCDEGYYRRAIGLLASRVAAPVVAFFSDDLDWCRDRLSGGFDAVYADWNRGPDAWRDMRLMTLCDGLVMSNSSFSWWGARLGRDPARPVVAPSRWYGGRHADNTDIALPGWIRLGAKGE